MMSFLMLLAGIVLFVVSVAVVCSLVFSRRGYVVTEWKLFDCSLVSVPANLDAVIDLKKEKRIDLDMESQDEGITSGR